MNAQNSTFFDTKHSVNTGKTVRVLSQKELIADMCSYNRMVSKSRETAIDALRKAGITDSTGQLLAIYRF
jgi:hypothetical protein